MIRWLTDEDRLMLFLLTVAFLAIALMFILGYLAANPPG